MYTFLLPSYSNFVRVFQIHAVTLQTGLGVREGHWKCHYSIESLWLLLMFYSNYAGISGRFWDSMSKISRLSNPAEG